MVTPLLSPVSETRAGLVYMVEGPVGIAKGARQGVPQVDRMILLFWATFECAVCGVAQTLLTLHKLVKSPLNDIPPPPPELQGVMTRSIF